MKKKCLILPRVINKLKLITKHEYQNENRALRYLMLKE